MATDSTLFPGPSLMDAMPTPEEVRVLRERIEASLRAILAAHRQAYFSQPVLAPLYDDLSTFVCRPGKRLRPLLFLLAHRLFQQAHPRPDDPSSPAREQDSLPVAVSLELLHAFILIHDDIIDRAELRRGLPAPHRLIEGRLPSFSDRPRIGRNLALVLGDIAFAIAQKCLLEARLPDSDCRSLSTLLLGCMVETGCGEAADIVHGTRDISKVCSREIEEMNLLKTTRYTIECPLAMAAVLAGAEPQDLDTLRGIARPVGLAFQIQNDLQEFARFECSDAEVPSDFLEGKKTLLLHTAYSRLNKSDQGLLQLCLSNGEAVESRVSQARDLVAGSGAVGQLSERMSCLFAQASARIEAASPPFFVESTRAGLRCLIALVRQTLAHA